LAAAVIAVAAGIVTAAGCSSGGGLDVHPSVHATTPATPHPGASSTAILNGVQLAQILDHAPPPSGWSSGKGLSSGESNSGSMVTPPYGPQRSNSMCSDLNSAVQAMSFIQWWSSSNAVRNLTYPSEPADLPQVDVAVGAYQPGYAAKTMAKAAALIGSCRSFHDKAVSNALITTSTRTIPSLGDQNLFLTSVENASTGKITAQVFLVRVGNYIVGVDTNTASAGQVRPATVQGFGGWLVQLLQSKSLT
jgi:hypothetical protein